MTHTEARQDTTATGGARRREPWRGRGSWLAKRARRLVVHRLRQLADGELTVHEDGGTEVFGDAGSPPLRATVEIHAPQFWERVAWGGSIGGGEAFCEGLWSTPDLTSVTRIFARNQEALHGLDSFGASLAAPLRRLLHRLRSNTRSGSLRNIAAHYDTGNEFFSKFLDPTLMYSCAIFPEASSDLEEAQRWKLETICRKLELGPDDHLLEIGTGWGGLALHAARNHGCRVTTTTISQRQFEYATALIEGAGLADRVRILKKDYRDLPGALEERFDKLVSIEMIEAVGHRFLPTYFEVIGDLLKPDGLGLIQAITIPDHKYEAYRRSVDFIQRYIFPGGLLPSIGRMRQCLRERELRVLGLDDLTPHYARTLRAWNANFEAREAEVAALGLTEPQRRKWKYYFGYCEGGFLEKVIGDVQILFGGPQAHRAHLTEEAGGEAQA